MNDTFLPPIEKPDSLIMKMVFYFTRKQFGKVLAPLSVHSARLPNAFGMFYGKVSQLDKKLILKAEIALLIRQQVARVNICLFCIDMSRWAALKAKFSEAKIDALDNYVSSTLFNAAEKTALDYATELTRNKIVNPETFKRLAAHYNEREICEIVWLVASEHLYNITNIGLNIHSEMICDTYKKKMSK
jgi:alkylhydroperoxidase family enzyme